MTGLAITDADVAVAAAAVHRFLSGRLHDPVQVDDVCQEAVARLVQARDRLDSAAATPYAITVAKSIVVGDARKAEVARRHAHRIGDAAPPPSPEDLALQGAESAAVSSALRSLAADERHELLAHVIEGQPVAALAAESGGTAEGVAARLARTRARMRVDYVVAARGSTLPSERCHPVLVALSAGDRRRQRLLGTEHHLLDCETCASLAPPLLKRQRRLVGLVPIPALASLLGRVRHGMTASHVVAGAAVGGVVVTAAVIVATSGGAPQPPAVRPAIPLTANGAALLPLNPAGLRAHAGQPVTGTAVAVQPPLAPMDGFFVGDSPADSIFVDLADSLPNVPTQPLTPYQPGQRLNFTGRLVANTPQYIAEARDADHIPNVGQIIARGYHIDAAPTDVRPA